MSDDKENSNELIIGLAGDLMLARRVGSAIFATDYQELRDGLHFLFKGADICCANLEAPLAEKAECLWGFKAPPQGALALRGIHILNLANNHILDCGDDGAVETIAALDALQIRHIGVGLDEAEAFRPAIIEAKNRKVAFIGCCCENLIRRPLGSRLAVATTEARQLDEMLKHLRPQVDVICLIMHAGNEYVPYPPPSLRKRIRSLLDSVNIVVTHHPHVLGGHEFLQRRLVWYSLGDFVFDSFLEYRRCSALLMVHWDTLENRFKRFRMLPIRTDDRFIPLKADPQIAGKINQWEKRVTRRLGSRFYDRLYFYYYLTSFLDFQVHRLLTLLRTKGLRQSIAFSLSRLKYAYFYFRHVFSGDYR